MSAASFDGRFAEALSDIDQRNVVTQRWLASVVLQPWV
jgi:hypothetical protein